MKKILFSMLRKLWYLMAFFIVLLAIIVILARALTPLLNEHRSDFEHWASGFLHHPVQIGSLQAWWQGIEPDLKLNNVTVYTKDHKQIILSVKELQVNISVLKSLMSWHLQPSHLEISGVHFTVYQEPRMHIKVQGITEFNITPKESKPFYLDFQETTQWLFAQRHISLTDVTVDWHYQKNKPIAINLQHLDFLNRETKHHVSAYATIIQPQGLGNVHLVALLNGDPDELENDELNVYAKLDNVDVSAFVNHEEVKGYRINQGMFDGEIWSNWKNKKWDSLKSVYAAKHVNLSVPNSQQPLEIKNVSGHLSLLPFNNAWQLTSDFSDLHLKRWKKAPGIKGLSGKLDIQPEKGRIQLDSNEVQFDFGKLFPTALSANRLKAFIHWSQRFDKSWVIRAENISAINEQAAVDGEAGLILPPDYKKPILSVLAGFDIKESAAVKNYFPVGLFSDGLTQWLNQAFVQGDGASGTVVVRGALGDFPFDHHNGTFVVDSEVRNLDFNYAPGWPHAKKMNAHLVFDGRKMSCVASSGKIYGASLTKGEAHIPIIGKKNIPEKLHVNLNIDSDASDILQFLHHSPLEKTIGKSLSPIKMKGNTQLDLKFMVPLAQAEKTQLRGSADLLKVDFNFPSWNIGVDQAKGKLFFTEKDFSSTLLHANFLNTPSTFSIKTLYDGNREPITRVYVRSHADIASLEEHFKWPKIPYIKGAMNYTASLDLKTGHQNDAQSELTISSNLIGVAVDLPAPFYKTTQTRLPFNMQLWLGNHVPPRARITCAKRFNAALSYHEVQNKFQLWSVNLRFGQNQSQFYNEQGLYINGYLPTFDWQRWKTFLAQSKQNATSKNNQMLDDVINHFFRMVSVQIGRATLFGQEMHNALIKLESLRNNWVLNIDSLRIVGNVFFPKGIPGVGVTAHFKRLFLQSVKTIEKDKINPGKIPSLDIVVDNFQYGDQYYGTAHLITTPQVNGLKIKRLIINSPLISGDMTGSWRLLNKQYSSQLIGELHTPDFDRLLKTWNFHSSVLAKTGQILFDLNWPGKLYSPKLKLMKGDVSVKLHKGYIVDLGEKARSKLNLGRLLSLLNIHRLLLMDFSDLAHRGFGFKIMRGHFKLNDGKLTIVKAYFDGAVARIDIHGELSLIKQMLHLNLIVVPYVTSSLPIIATIAGGPVAGAVTWAANKLFSKEVAKLTKYYYQVTGSWHKPVIKELEVSKH